MAKKRRKKKKKNKKLIFRKKIRKLLFRTVLLAMGVAAGILARPAIISDPVKRAQVENIRQRVLQANDEGQEKALQALEESADTVKGGVDAISDITEKVSGQDPKQVVQDTVDTITDEVKALPENQIKKIKLQFCRDVIDEIELTCQE